MLGVLFDVFLPIWTYISLVLFPQVVQKQTLGEVKYWTVTDGQLWQKKPYKNY